MPGRFKGKNPMLEDYNVMVRQVTHSHGLDYLDMRDLFMQNIPCWWGCVSGYITKDGEHQNEKGTIITAKIFAATLRKWLEGPLRTSLK